MKDKKRADEKHCFNNPETVSFLVIYYWTLKVNGRNGIYQLIQQQSELLHNGAELCIYHPWGPINPCKFLKLGWHLFSSFYFEL